MTKEEIISGNKVLAEYLGYKYYPHTEPYGKDKVVGWINPKLGIINPHFKLCRSHNDLPFYNDWNALMMVVDKIETEGVVVSIIKNTIAIHNYSKVYSNSNGVDLNVKIKHVWKTCLDYLNQKSNDNK